MKNKNLIGYCLLLALWGCLTNSSNPQPKADETTNQVETKKPLSENIIIANTSNYDNIGFVRMPLLHTYEPNLFINKSTTVIPDEQVELFYAGNTHVIYILKPGDSIVIKNNPTTNKITPFTLTSNQEERNNEIQFFENAVLSGCPLLYTENDNQKYGLIGAAQSVASFETINKIYKSNMAFTENYIKSKPISSEFKSFIDAYLKYDFFYKTLVYCSTPTIDSLKKNNFYDYTAGQQNIYTSANYMLDAYLYNYNKRLNKHFANIDSFCMFSKTNFDKYLSSRSIFLRLKNETNNPKTQQYYNHIQEDAFKTALESMAGKSNQLTGLIGNLLNEKNEKKVFKEILTNNSKQFVYVDFWASWCVPCRHEFKYYDSLQQVLGGKVKFIFISIDESIDAWKKVIAGEPILQKNDNYILYKADKALLKKYGLESIPKYKLYSNTGKLLNDDMYRPSEPAIYNYIKNL